MFKKVLIIGASRGLGRSLVHFAPQHLETLESLTAVSRHSANSKGEIRNLSLDMSRDSDQAILAEKIEKEDFDLVIYSAGGGPHGEFAKKEWKDHAWALQVGLVAPMRLALKWLQASAGKMGVGKFVIVGSRIAGGNADPLSASYAASKHGLVGFVSSLQDELKDSPHQIGLFSPGYMDTEMLPASAPVRHNGSKILNPDTAAQALFRWIKQKESPWHRVLS